MPLLFDIPEEESSIIKVLGVGGGGSNAVNHMYNQGIVGVDFAICNTDIQALDDSKVPYKIQLGKDLTDGRGAGSKPEVGREACLETIDEVKRFLEKNTKMLFVTAGLGGGTGTGAAPIIAKAAKELDILTVGIVTLPFKFEGAKRAQYAENGLKEMRKSVDSLIVISNDKLREIYGNLHLTEAFAQADNILTTAAKGIAEIITVSGVINVDFEDVNTVMRESGVCIMGTAEMEGEDRARKAIEAALNSPLIEDNDIRGAANILLNISSGTKEITMDEITEITNYVTEAAGPETNIIWGNGRNDDLRDKIAVTIIATGFKESRFTEKTTKTGVVILGEETGMDQTYVEKGSLTLELDINNSEVVNVVEEYPKISGTNTDPYEEQSDIDVELRSEYLMKEKQRREDQRSSMKQINSKTLENLEKVPAYLRRNMKLEGVSAQETSSGIFMDEEESEGTENNFLHRNVD